MHVMLLEVAVADCGFGPADLGLLAFECCQHLHRRVRIGEDKIVYPRHRPAELHLELGVALWKAAPARLRRGIDERHEANHALAGGRLARRLELRRPNRGTI